MSREVDASKNFQKVFKILPTSFQNPAKIRPKSNQNGFKNDVPTDNEKVGGASHTVNPPGGP